MTPIRIGLVFDTTVSSCRHILRGIRRYAENKPDWFFAIIAPTPTALSSLRRLKPAGLIAQIFDSPLAKSLLAFRRPLVNTASFNASPLLTQRHIPQVGADNRQIGELSATYFLERGLRHFGFVGHPHFGYSLQREESFCQTIEAAGYTVHRFHKSEPEPHMQLYQLWSPDASLLRWLKAAPKPIGILACQDVWGMYLVEACHRIGLRVPDDVALLGVDNDDLLCELSRPALSSVGLPYEHTGHEAANQLDRLLSGDQPAAECLLFPPLGVVSRLSTDILAIDDAEVTAAIRFIRARGHLPLRVRDVLREVPLSRRDLERRFFRVFHYTLGEEIRRAHLERAKELLTETDLSTAQIAERAGFANAKRLATVFRLKLGLTPLAYRRQFRPR